MPGREWLGQGPAAGPRLVADNRGLVGHGLGKSFKRRPVLRDVNISVQRGEVVGLLGPNGAGKTTCFYIITGLIAADTGTVELDGQDITDLPMYRRARLGIGYLPQEASIFRGLTRRAEHPRHSRGRRARARDPGGDARRAAGRVLDQPFAARLGDGAVGRRAAALSRSPARWRPSRTSSCSTSRWPGSIRSRSATSATSWRTSRIAASAS